MEVGRGGKCREVLPLKKSSRFTGSGKEETIILATAELLAAHAHGGVSQANKTIIMATTLCRYMEAECSQGGARVVQRRTRPLQTADKNTDRVDGATESSRARPGGHVNGRHAAVGCQRLEPLAKHDRAFVSTRAPRGRSPARPVDPVGYPLVTPTVMSLCYFYSGSGDATGTAQRPEAPPPRGLQTALPGIMVTIPNPTGTSPGEPHPVTGGRPGGKCRCSSGWEFRMGIPGLSSRSPS